MCTIHVLNSTDRKIECYLLSEGPCPEEAFDETSELRLREDVEVIQSMERFRSRSTLGRRHSLNGGTEAGQSRGSGEQQAARVGQGGNHRTGAGPTEYGHIVKGSVSHLLTRTVPYR